MNTTYRNENGTVEISVRQHGATKTAWALFVNGKYQKTKVLPNRNTAVVQNFGFAASDFSQI